MKKKILISVTLCLAALLVWTAFPRPLPCSAKEGLMAGVIRLGVENGEPVNESQSASLPANSEEALLVDAVLQKYRWRPTFETAADSIRGWFDDSGPSLNPGGGLLTVYFLDEESSSLTVTENGKVLLNNRRCRIGWFGKEKGQALYQELLTALEDHLE